MSGTTTCISPRRQHNPYATTDGGGGCSPGRDALVDSSLPSSVFLSRSILLSRQQGTCEKGLQQTVRRLLCSSLQRLCT